MPRGHCSLRLRLGALLLRLASFTALASADIDQESPADLFSVQSWKVSDRHLNSCPLPIGAAVLASQPSLQHCTATTTTTRAVTVSTVTSSINATTITTTVARTTLTTTSLSTRTTSTTTTRGHVVVPCNAPHSFYDLGGSCSGLASGESCTGTAGSSTHECVAAGPIAFKCPGGNVNANVDPYLVSSSSIRCRVCSVSAHIEDEDHRTGYFRATIKWGPNMLNGYVNETMIDRYYVLIVDTCDIVLKVAGMLPKRGDVPTGCCMADAYALQVQVALPPRYHRFNIMAVKDGTPGFIVQGGLSSGPIVDALHVLRSSSQAFRRKVSCVPYFAMVFVLAIAATAYQ